VELFEQLENRQFLSASPVAELAQEGGVAELARREPRAVSRLAHRPAAPTKAARPVGEQRPRNPVATLASTGGGAAVSELAQSEPGAVAALVRANDGETGGGEGGGGENGGGENGGGTPTNPVAVIATTEGGAAVSELAQSEPGAIAALVRSDDGETGGGGGGGGETPAPRANPVADLATTEGGSAVAELAGSEAGAVADLLK
jgi:hypothetical protein